MKLKLKRKHAAGYPKINDRKKKEDGSGDYVKMSHRLSKEAFDKPFDVYDVEFVLEKHGAILEKA